MGSNSFEHRAEAANILRRAVRNPFLTPSFSTSPKAGIQIDCSVILSNAKNLFLVSATSPRAPEFLIHFIFTHLQWGDSVVRWMSLTFLQLLKLTVVKDVLKFQIAIQGNLCDIPQDGSNNQRG